MAVMGLRLAARSQRRRQAARRGQPRDVQRPVARRRRSTRCRSARSPTACTAARWVVDRGRRAAHAGRSATTGTSADAERVGARPRRRPPPRSGTRSNAGRARAGRASSAQRLGDDVLDPDALTIGFARRFATYKRATLLLVAARPAAGACCIDADRPVQFVFAGKAHPADTPGKELIQQIEQFAREADVRHRFVFLADYDIAIARDAVPRLRRVAEHPAPAAGGVRHERDEGGAQRGAQLLDPRRLVGRVLRRRATAGRSTRPRTTRTSSAATSARRASLFDLLEEQIVPLFYDRGRDGVPAGGSRWSHEAWAHARPAGHRGADGARLHHRRCTSRRPRRRPRSDRRRRRRGRRAGRVATPRRRRPGRRSRSRRVDVDDERPRHRGQPTGHRDRGARTGWPRRRARRGAPRHASATTASSSHVNVPTAPTGAGTYRDRDRRRLRRVGAGHPRRPRHRRVAHGRPTARSLTPA